MAFNAQTPEEIPKAYDPRRAEDKWYQFWLEKGYFTPSIDPKKKPFVIIMPPPNITGELHLGHALTTTIEDILIRWHRMKGEPTLWLPGIDHAGIASQNVVEQLLAKEGLSRHDLGREKFLERMGEWMNKYGRIIAEQHKKLGASCDWTRERFTMDPGSSRAVRTTFVRLYQKGLIYRGERIINWCPRCATALSDLEVEHQDVLGNLYYVLYPLETSSGRKRDYIQVATTRPETILGDTAVAVHPNDKRYQDLIGRRALLPVLGRVIPVIADEAVDPAFGTGAVKITPAHDPVDFEVGQRHRLPSVKVINEDGTMNKEAGPYQGLDRYACREALLRDLERERLLVKVDPYVISLGHCERCGTTIEPINSMQWFVSVKPLAQPAIQAVLDGRIRIIPERFTKVYLNWMENIRDWCISRQLWWGHRIPVWYCDSGHLTVALEDSTRCAQCDSPNIVQDPDVLDTWFSSALWPHSTLGWPDDTKDLRYFYPTSVMETGYDILFFWVARMILMGLENTGQVPFRVVYLHGLVRDERGEKMSKSKGNVVNPLEAIERYGTDALRFTLSTGSSPGNDIKISEQRLEASRNFANKLWNASRFILSNSPERATAVSSIEPSLPLIDRWILSRLNRLNANVNELLESYQLGEAQRQIYDFLWGEFCDWYIEMAKLRLPSKALGKPKTPKETSPIPILTHVLETSLRLLHPFMPFITEEVWQRLVSHHQELRRGYNSIMVAPYPTPDENTYDIKAEWQVNLITDIIRTIRNVRAEFGVEASNWIEAIASAGDATALIESHSQYISALTRVKPLTVVATLPEKPQQALSVMVEDVEIYLPLAGMVSLETERRRLQKEIDSSGREIDRLEQKLNNTSFVSKAPIHVVAREREKLEGYQARLERLRQRLASLGKG